MEQVEGQQQEQGDNLALTFRAGVDFAIVFGCVPALVLNVIFWAVATAFASVEVLPSIMALLITLLLALMGIVLIVRYVDVAVINSRKTQGGSDPSEVSVFAGVLCVFLAVCIVACLAMAGSLEGWHYTLMATEVLLVGYQTWRVFVGR